MKSFQRKHRTQFRNGCGRLVFLKPSLRYWLVGVLKLPMYFISILQVLSAGIESQEQSFRRTRNTCFPTLGPKLLTLGEKSAQLRDYLCNSLPGGGGGDGGINPKQINTNLGNSGSTGKPMVCLHCSSWGAGSLPGNRLLFPLAFGQERWAGLCTSSFRGGDPLTTEGGVGVLRMPRELALPWGHQSTRWVPPLTSIEFGNSPLQLWDAACICSTNIFFPT